MASTSQRHTRLFQPPDHASFFLFGPRGVGKSDWTRSALPEAVRLDLLEPEVFRTFSAHPERLRQWVDALHGPQVIVIDEVQKLPQLLEVVHALIETRPNLRFVLTGSSARKLRRAGVDLLAGRAVLRTLHPFVAQELGESFSVDRALKQGLVPLIHAAPAPMDALRAYVALYVQQEVQYEGLVRNIGAFHRFLEAMAFSHAAPVNLTAVARDCEVPRRTVAGFVAILDDLLLGFRVPVFTRAARREMTQHEKFYYFDTGVFRALRPAGPLDRPSDIEGAALEGLVAQHLRAWIAYSSANTAMYHWRTAGGSEVDFVLYGDACFVAIEVKSTAQVRPEDLRGLKAFGSDYPMAKRILLYRGEEAAVIDGIDVRPLDPFLHLGAASLC